VGIGVFASFISHLLARNREKNGRKAGGRLRVAAHPVETTNQVAENRQGWRRFFSGGSAAVGF
jgi:hypothetical protein